MGSVVWKNEGKFAVVNMPMLTSLVSRYIMEDISPVKACELLRETYSHCPTFSWSIGESGHKAFATETDIVEVSIEM